MALNTSGSIANPTKAKTIGLTDVIRADGYTYTTLLTVLSNQTLKIEDGVVSIACEETSGTYSAYLNFFINISGKRLPLVCEFVDISGRTSVLISLKDILVTGITLTTGDTIKLECVYTNTGILTGDVNATFLINDYQA